MAAILDLDQTIAAIASPPGAAARAIVRVSGPDAGMIAWTIFQPDDAGRWQSWRFPGRHPGWVRAGLFPTQTRLDAYLWPTARSYTGQPTVELHAPGSPILAEAILEGLFRGGCRPARAGEFTLRAFLAGRVDLAQAEAVLGVIDAGDQSELQLALSQLAGGLSGRIAEMRGDLLSLLADLEAGLDFVDEDIEFVSRRDVLRRVAGARRTLRQLLADAHDRWRQGATARIVLAGLPNAGKSTLFNALAGREQALVSTIPGTTRDWLTTTVAWDSTRFELVDTAGWEVPGDRLSRAMQSLRADQLDRADLLLWCRAADLDAGDARIDRQLQRDCRSTGAELLEIITKSDLAEDGNHADAETPPGAIRVSAKENLGIDSLREDCLEAIRGGRARHRSMLGSTAARGRESLASAADALDRLTEAAQSGFGDEILSAELRLALGGLAAVVGEVYTDDLLDLIFSRFCIGK